MAEKREIIRLSDKLNIVIGKEHVLQAMDQSKIKQIQDANTIEEYLFQNAEIIDIQKLLMIIIVELKKLAEVYKCFSKKKEEEIKKEERKAIQLARNYIKPEEEIKIIQIYLEETIGKIKIETSKHMIYGEKEKNRNLRYDEIKKVIPEIETQDIMDLYNVYKQMIGEEYIAKMAYATILENTLLHQGYTEEEIKRQYANYGTIDTLNEMMENMAQVAQSDSFNKSFGEALEGIKGSINADKYLLFHIYKIHQKLENKQELKEDEAKFLENLDSLLKKSKDKTKIKIGNEVMYGKEDASRFLARVNLQTKEYSTEEQLRTGEKLLQDTNGYENYLKILQIRELAKHEGNLLYLFQKKKINKTEVANILRTIEASEDTIVDLYAAGGILPEQLEEYAQQKNIDLAELKQKIKQKKQIDINHIDLKDKETWNLLTEEEKLSTLAQRIEQENHKVLDQLDQEEVETLVNAEKIAQMYREIYGKGNEDKREKYENLIKIYNVKKNNEEEIITLLEDELSDAMLINLYSDHLISIELLESYGEKELVVEAFNQGKIHQIDMRKTILRFPIELPEKQAVKLYQNRVLSINDMVELYLQDKTKLRTLEKLGEDLENYLTQENLIEQYKQAKKSKDSKKLIRYKRYVLLYQTIKEEKIDEKVFGDKEFTQEDIIQFYKNNLLTIRGILSYGGKEFVQKLAIEGSLMPKDAKEIFRQREEILKIEELLQNPNMEDIQKMMLIYSTYDEDKEKRDYLVNYLQTHASDKKGESNRRGKSQENSKINEGKRKITTTDPYERWKLFSTLDKGYTKTYVDGYLIVTLKNSQTTIIEKMYQKKQGVVLPAYEVATFILDTDNYIAIEEEIIKEGRVDISKVRRIAKDRPDLITKITHHQAKKMEEEKKNEKNRWGERILVAIGKDKIEEIYTQTDMQEIEECLRDIEASREEWTK